MPWSPPMRFCSIVGQASIQTARASGPSTMERSSGLPPPLGIQAPRPRARGRDVEPDEAAQRREDAVVGDGPEPQRSRELEVGHRHLAGQHKGDRTCEQAEEQEGPADDLEDAGDPKFAPRRGGGSVWRHPDREGDELHRAGLNEDERGEDAEHAEQPRGPARPLRDDVRGGHDVHLLSEPWRPLLLNLASPPTSNEALGNRPYVSMAVSRSARHRRSRRASPKCSAHAANSLVGPRHLSSSISRNSGASVRSVARRLNSSARSRCPPSTVGGKSSMREGSTPNFSRTPAALRTCCPLRSTCTTRSPRTHCARCLSGVQMQTFSTLASAEAMWAAEASASSASSSIMGHTATPMAARAASSGWNCASSPGSMPAPVLYSDQSALRKDSMTWSVATPMWVAPCSIISNTECSTPPTAPKGSSSPLVKRRRP